MADKTLIGKNIKRLRGSLSLTQSEFGQRVGIDRAAVSLLEGGKNLPSLPTLNRMRDEYRVYIDYFFVQDASIEEYKMDADLNADLNADLQGKTKPLVAKKHAHPNAHPNAHLHTKSKPLVAKNQVSEPEGEYRTITIDNEGNEAVPITELRAAAGSGYLNEEFIQESDHIMLPGYFVKGDGMRLWIRVKGDSMSPTFQDGSFVLIRHIPPSEWRFIRDEHIHVVVTNEGDTLLKRVKNRLDREKPFLSLMSDNPDKASYGNIHVTSEEIVSIWYAEWYLSAKMPNIHNQFYSRVTRLEDGIEMLSEEVKIMRKHLKNQR